MLSFQLFCCSSSAWKLLHHCKLGDEGAVSCGCQEKTNCSANTQKVQKCTNCVQDFKPEVLLQLVSSGLDSFVMCVCIIATVEKPPKQRQWPSCDLGRKKCLFFPPTGSLVLSSSVLIWLIISHQREPFITLPQCFMTFHFYKWLDYVKYVRTDCQTVPRCYLLMFDWLEPLRMNQFFRTHP